MENLEEMPEQADPFEKPRQPEQPKQPEQLEQLQFEEFQRYTQAQKQAMSYYEISELRLPMRIMNLLEQNHCTTLAQAAAFAEENPVSGYKGGKKVAGEIFSAIDAWIRVNPIWKTQVAENTMNYTEQQKEVFQAVSSALSPFIRIQWDQLAGLVETEEDIPAVDQYLNLPFEQQISVILKHNLMRSSLVDYWQEMTKNGITEICEFESRAASMPLEFDTRVLIRCSLDAGIIHEVDGYYLMKRQTVSEYINSTDFDNKPGQILKMRFNGAKLEKIGDEFNLSRERVRQIISSRIRKFPLLFEDYFAEPFQAYKFTEEEFRRLFPEISEDGFSYLTVQYGKGKESIDQVNPDDYSGLWKERVSDFIQNESDYRKMLFRSSRDVIWSVLKDHVDHPLSLDSFQEEYSKMVGQMAQRSHNRGQEARAPKSISNGTLTNFLRREKGVVFNRENKVRFCETDPKTIWEAVDFARYRHLVISAELIYRDYSDLMAELHILDGYELFYMVKNSLSDFSSGDFHIRCRRVPVIVFDDVSEDEQALQLLKELSPVSHNDYYESYEQRFGIRKDSAHGDPVIQQALEPYNMGREYIFDGSTLSVPGG